MSTKPNNRRPAARSGRRRVFLVERLEDRRLLATGTFNAPSLSGLIAQAWEGQDTSQAAINTMLKALQTQLTSGPLADLQSGAVNGDGYVTEVQSLVGSYSQNVNQQLLPHFVNIDQMLLLQGQRMAADAVAINQANTVGLIDDATAVTDAQTAINSLTSGPIYSLDTPVSDYVSATQLFETELNSVAAGLGASTSPLSTADANLTVQALAEAYRANLHAGLQVTHPNISNEADTAITTLENASASITSTGTAAQAELTTAITAFDTAILDTTGLFGPQGNVSRVNTEYGYVPHNLTINRSDTSMSSVSGTGTSAGTATLTATLTSASTGTGISGAIVSFTLDGAFAGTAVTDSSGVATLTDVPTIDNTGTTTGAVVASFAGDLANKLSFNSGDLVLNQDGSTTTLTSSLNPSGSGQSVTFTATVAAATGTGTPTGTVTFKDGTTTLGTGTLNGTGVATFGTTTLTVGTHSITAVYGGDTNFTTSTSTAVSQAVNQAPAITSTTSTAFTAGTAGTFTVTTTGFPTATLSQTGTLPTGVTFTPNANGTATLTSTAATPAGSYPLTIKATNGISPDATQSFTLTVNQAPAITGATSTTFTTGTAGTFTVTTTGFPTATLSQTGTLPTGVTFTPNANGTATLASTTATPAGSYPLTIKAANGITPDATQSFTLTVSP